MGHIERITLGFPGKNNRGAIFASGVPGAHYQSGAVGARNDSISAYVQDPDQSAVKFTIPERHGMPCTYIGIDPESSIASCHLLLGGRSTDPKRVHLSAGNPLIGAIEEDFALVTIPNSLPAVNSPLSADNVAVHDFVNNGTTIGWPLRLELGYGDIHPIRANERAPLFAHFIGTPTASTFRTFYVCVDGRRRIDVIANTEIATTTLRCYSLETFKVSGQSLIDSVYESQLPLNDDGDLSVVVAPSATASQAFSFFGNPISVLKIEIEQTVAYSVVQVHVKAYDK
jgi:hypothetical protein